MAKEIMTFEQLPKAVSELTNQVMELRDMVAALKPSVPDENAPYGAIKKTTYPKDKWSKTTINIFCL